MMSRGLGSALAAYAAMIRDLVAPSLRELGLRGSGSAFVLPDDRHWALVGFQKARTSDRGEVRFTVNLAAVDKLEWEQARTERLWLPAWPSGNSRYPVGTVVRLGLVMPEQVDRWWSVSTAGDATRVGAEVVASIRNFGVPWLRARLT